MDSLFVFLFIFTIIFLLYLIISSIQNRVAEFQSKREKKKILNEERLLKEEKKEAIKKKILQKKYDKDLEREAKNELIKDGLLLPNIGGKREPIPQGIMDKVWNRDNGQCVLCSSKQNLEFDHIIPFSKGGSNTYRNLQLLCRSCNAKKSNNIG